MPISKSELQDMATSPGTYQKGVSYYKSGRVTIIRNSYGSDGHTVSALVSGSGGRRYHVLVRMSADDTEVLECDCECPAFSSYVGICKHIVATILKAMDMPATQLTLLPPVKSAAAKAGYGDSGIKTDPTAIDLMQRYAQRLAAQARTDSAEGTAVFEPTLELWDVVPMLSFKIGEKRLYILKDISKFTTDMQNGANVEYGKQFSFHHDLSNFEKSCRPLVRFVLEQFHESDNSYYKFHSYYSFSDIKKYMILTPYMLDEFMKLYIEKEVCVTQGTEIQRFQVLDQNPDLTVKLYKKKSSGYGLKLTSDISLLCGAEKIYVFEDNKIYRCGDDYSKTCSDFLKTISESKHGLSFSENNMKALASTVLSVIKPYIEVESKTDLADYEPLPLVTKVYFDMPVSNTVTAQMKFCYGDNEHDAFTNKNLSVTTDIKGEFYAESVLKKYFKNSEAKNGTLAINEDEDAVYNLISDGVGEISGFAEVYATDAFKKIQIKPPVTASVGVRLHSDLLEMDFNWDGLDPAELIDVLHSYRQAKKYHRLRDGSFLNLQSDSLAEFSELAEGLDLNSKEILSGKISVPKYRALYLDSLMKQSEEIKYDRNGEFKKIIRDMNDVSDADFEVPQSLKPILRNYQKTGYRWLRTISAYGFGGILADDMGLGKTIQILALLLSQKNENKEHSVSLVVCPSSLVLNWESEVNHFTPALRAVTVSGPAAQRDEALQNFKDADLLITSYDSLKRDIENYKDLEFEYEIIDEAQYIKNHNTQNAKAVKAVNSRIRFALTGTPVENSLAELWSIYDYLMPGYLFSYNKFRKKLEVPIVRSNDENAVKKLRHLVQPFILRRLKKDVLKELPEKTETVLYAEMTDEQKKLYMANVALTKEKLAKELQTDESGKGKLLILAMLTKLRELCCDPALLYDNYHGGSAKLELCMDVVESCVEAGHKLLLFSQFTSMLRIIEKRLQASDIGFYKIVGSTPPSERLALVNSFNADKTPVFLISLKAGGTGLNLTGADVVIHYDPWWNISAQNQATDRAHRIGQKKNVQIYKLIAKQTIEEKILKMQREKADLADKIIKDGGNSLAKMSKQELLDLFE